MQNHNLNEIKIFTMPRVGEQKEDIQDACKFSEDKSRVAIADGASTSLWPMYWAELLVKHFCNNQDSIESIQKTWERWLLPIQEQWRKYYWEIKNDPNIPWNVKGWMDKDHGSATFVGLEICKPNQAGKKIWKALAVGDSCLFHFKHQSDELVSFPISKSTEFTTVTEGVSSLPKYQSFKPSEKYDSYEYGDIFILATDALAQWILYDKESSSNRWKKLINLSKEEEFASFIKQLRGDRLIKDDDTTLCRIEVVTPIPPTPVEDYRKWFIVLASAGVIAIVWIAIWQNKNQLYPQEFINKTSTVTNVPTSNKNTSNGDNSSNYDRTKFPIYAVDNTSNEPIGYVWNKPSTSENVQFWVHTPKLYIKGSKIEFNSDKNPLPLYTDKPKPQNLDIADFAGYLLPGKYPASDFKHSQTFTDTRWAKIKVRLAK